LINDIDFKLTAILMNIVLKICLFQFDGLVF